MQQIHQISAVHFSQCSDRITVSVKLATANRIEEFRSYRATPPDRATYNRSNAKGGIGQGVNDMKATTNNKIKAERIHRIVAMLLELDEVTLDRMEEALKSHVTDGVPASVIVRDRP